MVIFHVGMCHIGILSIGNMLEQYWDGRTDGRAGGRAGGRTDGRAGGQADGRAVIQKSDLIKSHDISSHLIMSHHISDGTKIGQDGPKMAPR